MTVIELITCIRQHKKASLAILVLALLLGKIASVPFGMHGVGTFEGERNDILRRRNYLIGKLATTPQKVMKEMPGGMDADVPVRLLQTLVLLVLYLWWEVLLASVMLMCEEVL